MPVPLEIRTPRLLLRPWRAEDAVALHPVLEANFAHLGPWIPARVSTPAPVPELAQRLAGFAADFDDDRGWRYAMFALDDEAVLGELSLFPRSATGRVPYLAADRAELGYWLRADMTGRGLVTEAARAVLAVAAGLPRFSHVEIRCDARNAPSAAVPQRLGFVLASTIPDAAATATEPPIRLQVWTSSLADGATPTR